MTAKTPGTPAGLASSGRALWREVIAGFDLGEHELALLREACRTVDAIDRLQAALDADSVLDTSPQGRRVHPALPELRQQRVVLGRLLAQLGVPAGDEDARPKRRAARGAYTMRAVQ